MTKLVVIALALAVMFNTVSLTNEFENQVPSIGGSSYNRFWLGLHDSEKPGYYRWLDDLTVDKPWIDTYRISQIDRSPNCLVINKVLKNRGFEIVYHTQWMFQHCSMDRSFFCEYPAFGQASTCGLGWLEMEPSVCVRIQTQSLTWSLASNECRKRGGHLMDTISTGHRWRFFQGKIVKIIKQLSRNQ
ncbi:hypothetical protein ElyMa_002765200 [Elysia marginata]|uniref:C-type lectin domain-containing protein n=1 Tax=Elysia marginata TaxID=1093978 RepID=A0AAV4HJ67_9GAST|nr:hypothetical protein ElyMa_002765200 [Elysia marginata]